MNEHFRPQVCSQSVLRPERCMVSGHHRYTEVKHIRALESNKCLSKSFGRTSAKCEGRVVGSDKMRCVRWVTGQATAAMLPQ